MSASDTSGMFLDTEKIITVLGLAPGMHVADLGCGTGYFTMSAARAVGHSGVITAVDIQTGPLEAVRSMAEATGLGNIRTVRANLEVAGGTGLSDNSQDLVLLTNVLFQSQQKEAIIKESLRVLKPGGRLLVVDWHKEKKGFGPPAELRTSEAEMKKMVEDLKARFQRPVDAGQFYYGLLFIKP